MRYFKARSQDTAPFIVWDQVAESLEELTALGLHEDPLVRPLDNLPSYEGSICHSTIVNGELVDRDATQLNDYKNTVNQGKLIANNAARKETVDKSSFQYDGTEYPMDAASQLRYQAMFANLPADTKIQTKTGVVGIVSADIPAFKTAYFDAVLTKTDPTQ